MEKTVYSFPEFQFQKVRLKVKDVIGYLQAGILFQFQKVRLKGYFYYH